MGKFCVSVDSVADISSELYNFLSVESIRFNVRIGNGLVSDRVVSGDELSSLLDSAAGAEQFGVTVPSRKEYEEFFDELAEKNENIIHICHGACFSSAHLNALYAAKNTMTKYYGSTVYIIDGHSTCAGLALLAEYAVNLRNLGYTADDAFVELSEVKQRVEQYVITGDIARFNGVHPSGSGEIARKTGAISVIAVDDIGKPLVYKRCASSSVAIGTIASRYVAEHNASPIFVWGSSDVSLLLKTVAIMRKKNATNVKMSTMGVYNSLLFGKGSVYVAFLGKPPKSRIKPKFNPGKNSDFFTPEE